MSSQPSAERSPPNGKLENFLQRAGSVLARERGINAKSRVLLAALARELALEEEEFQQGIAQLQAGSVAEAPVDPAVVARREKYRKYVRAQVKKLPRGILTSSLEMRIVEAGHYSHDLSPEDSGAVVREVVAEAGVRVVSREEAERHVLTLIEQQVRDAAWVDDVTLRRLHAVGIEWGLTNEAIDALIESHLETGRQSVQVGERWRYGLLTAGGLVPLALLVFILWAVFFRGEVEPGVATPGGDTKLLLPPAPSGAANVPGDAWWDKNLTAGIVFLRLNMPARTKTLEGLRAAEPAERAAAYRALAQPDAEELRSPPRLNGLTQVDAGCLALEPDPMAYSALRDTLLAHLPSEKDGTSSGTSELYVKSAWAVDVFLAALAWDDIAEQRREALRGELAAALGAPLDPSLDRPQFERRALGLLYERLFHRMQVAAAADTDRARAEYDALMHQGAGYLDDAVRERLDAEFLAAVLPGVGDGYDEYLDLLRRTSESREPLNVLKLLEIYEKSDQFDLQNAIEASLRRRYDIGSEEIEFGDRPKVAAAVRKALGVRAPVVAKDRAGEMIRSGETALARAAGGDNPTVWLTQMVELAQANVLGCALLQKELGQGVFDEWRDREPPKLNLLSAGAESAPPDEPPTTGSLSILESQQRTIRGNASRLARFQSVDRVLRISWLRQIATLVERVSELELEPESAAGIAVYVLGNKPEAEQTDVLKSAAPILKKPAMILALADGLATTTMYRELVENLLTEVLERDVKFADGDGWRESYRLELLRKVQSDLARETAASSGSGSGGAFDEAAELLREAYTAQAKSTGVPAAQYQAAPSAAALLRLFVEAASSQLAGEKHRPEDADFIRRIPHELAVVDYYADHPIRQTVLLQRLWARLVGIAAARHQPERAADVDRLLAELAKSDAAAANVAVQLRNGEATILNLWMIAARGIK